MQKLIVVALVAVSLRANADPKKEAQQHVDRATELHKHGDFAGALDELKTAYALDPRPDLLYAMGQVHVRLGDCASAITYYERFLTTKPDPSIANAAVEAIEACKTNPPVVTAPVAKPPEVAAPSPPPPSPPPRREQSTAAMPWYGDHLADGLVAGGVVAGIASILFYRSAVSDRDGADTASTYQASSDLVDSANRDRGIAIALGVIGGALVVAGGIHFAIADHGDGLQISATGTGGTVTWTAHFR